MRFGLLAANGKIQTLKHDLSAATSLDAGPGRNPTGSVLKLVEHPPSFARQDLDPLALDIFGVLCELSTEDRAAVLRAILAPNHGVAPGRTRIIESALKRFANETGERISKRKYEEWRVGSADQSLPSASFITTTYGGSWTKSMNALGREPSLERVASQLRPRGAAPTNEEVLDDLRACALSEEKTTITLGEYQAWARKHQSRDVSERTLIVSSGAFCSRFGSFADACHAAGLKVMAKTRRPTGANWRWSRERIREALRRAAADIGDPAFTIAQYRAWRIRTLEGTEGDALNEAIVPSYEPIRKAMGSWPEAKIDAGLLSPDEAGGRSTGKGKKMPPQQIADGLLLAVDELGHPCTEVRYGAWRARNLSNSLNTRPPSPGLLKKKLKNWTNVQRTVAEALSTDNPRTTLTTAFEDGPTRG